MDVGTRLRLARFRSRHLRKPAVALRYRGLGPSDGFLASYPRSGTTWLRFLLSEILTGRPSSFDTDGTAVPYVGHHEGAPEILPGGGRLVMTHETRFRGERRVLYVIRDPRAVAVSEFRWLMRRRLIDGDIDRFVRDFVRGRSNPWGSWRDHVVGWRRSDAARAGKLLAIRYERLRSDPVEVLGHVVRFLGTEVSEAQRALAVERNSLEAMQRKEARAPDEAFAKGVRRDVRFVSTGQTTGWRSTLAPEHVLAIEDAFGPVMRAVGYDAGGTVEPRARSG
jgi:hypothetical protein